jgi:hypothetical protein
MISLLKDEHPAGNRRAKTSWNAYTPLAAKLVSVESSQ